MVISPHPGVAHLNLSRVGLGIINKLFEGLPGGIRFYGQGCRKVDHHDNGVHLFEADARLCRVLRQNEAGVYNSYRVPIGRRIGHIIPRDCPAPSRLVDDLDAPLDGLFKMRLQGLSIDGSPSPWSPGDDELNGPGGKFFLPCGPATEERKNNSCHHQNRDHSFPPFHFFLLTRGLEFNLNPLL